MSDEVVRDGIRPQERTDAPEQKPAGDLGGQPINADETAPRELAPNPDDEGSLFAQEFFQASPNALAELLPEFEFLSPVLRVIDVPTVADGQEIRVVMDGERDMALGFLCDPASGPCKP